MKLRQKILILGTYPVSPAMHGGQKRTEAIIQKYRQLGFTVEYASLSVGTHYRKRDKNDFIIDAATEKSAQQAPSGTFLEIIAAEAIPSSPAQVKFEGVLQAFSPDIIEFEQGYLFAGLSDSVRRICPNAVIGYSSHNVEYTMKDDIAKNEGVAESVRAPYVNKIRANEQALIDEADYVIAVSEDDAAQFKKMGAKKVILAPNGINPLSTNQTSREYWRQYRRKHHISKSIVYVASAHPPNLHGLRQLIDGVGFLPYDWRIMVAGSLSDMLKTHVGIRTIQDTIFWNRVMGLGRMSEAKLGALIESADVIILPILDGGGSNLKTAEALVADKPIVGTKHAFRSFEKLIDKLPNIQIADTPESFQQAILKQGNTTAKERTAAQQKAVDDAVLWTNCLTSLEQLKEIQR